MAMTSIFDVAGSAMSAQMLRLNTIASNLANTETISGSPDTVYKARHPVFESVLDNAMQDNSLRGVRVKQILESDTGAISHYMPENPLADAKGYVYSPAINSVEEMADMISASRSYQNNVEVLSSAKDLILRTLQLGRS